MTWRFLGEEAIWMYRGFWRRIWRLQIAADKVINRRRVLWLRVTSKIKAGAVLPIWYIMTNWAKIVESLGRIRAIFRGRYRKAAAIPNLAEMAKWVERVRGINCWTDSQIAHLPTQFLSQCIGWMIWWIQRMAVNNTWQILQVWLCLLDNQVMSHHISSTQAPRTLAERRIYHWNIE